MYLDWELYKCKVTLWTWLGDLFQIKRKINIYYYLLLHYFLIKLYHCLNCYKLTSDSISSWFKLLFRKCYFFCWGFNDFFKWIFKNRFRGCSPKSYPLALPLHDTLQKHDMSLFLRSCIAMGHWRKVTTMCADSAGIWQQQQDSCHTNTCCGLCTVYRGRLLQQSITVVLTKSVSSMINRILFYNTNTFF